MKRIKLEEPTIKSREQAVLVALELSLWTLSVREQNAAMEQEICEVRDKHQARIEEAENNAQKALDRLRNWAAEYPEEFGAAKSTDLVHAIVGFRKGTPRLKLINKTTMATLLDRLNAEAVFAKYIRTKKEVNKGALISDRNLLTEEQKAKLGIKIDAKESFFAELKADKEQEANAVEEKAA